MSKRNENTRQNFPTWCSAGSVDYPCNGEHRTESVYGYVPATAGLTRAGGPEGTSMDAMAVGLAWPEPWGEGHCFALGQGDRRVPRGQARHSLTLHLVGDGKDQSIDFKPSEALTFATSLIEMLALMVNEGVRIMFDVERILEVVENAETIRDAHKRTAVSA